MVQQQIVQFIQDNLKKGYTYEQIRQYLVSSGWNAYQVDEAIQYVYQLPSQPAQKKSKSLLLAVLFFVFALVISGVLVVSTYLSDNEPAEQPTHISQEVDYTLSMQTARVQPGEDLVFSNSLTNLQGYVVYPRYTVEDASDGTTVISWTEGEGVDDQDVVSHTIDPSTEPGRYNLIGIATFKGGQIKASTSFDVYVQTAEPTCNDGTKNQGEEDVDCGGPCVACPSCSDGIKNQGEELIDCGGPCSPCEIDCGDCDDFDACTQDSCEDGNCVHTLFFPCCGNFICEDSETVEGCPLDCDESATKPVALMTRSEVIDEAKTLSKKSAKDAGLFCDSVPDADIRDECMRVVAYNTENKNFCKYINYSVKRDACYMEFAMKYDYSVCPLIENQYLQRSCEALKVRPEPSEDG